MKDEYSVIIETDENHPFHDQFGHGFYVRETWYLDGKIHREFGPAVTLLHPLTLEPLRQEFFEHGRRHRSTGAAIIDYGPNSQIKLERQFFRNGERWLEGPELFSNEL